MQEQTIAGNWGEILNMGVDFNINWEHHVGKNGTYFIGGNVSWLHNRVMSLRDGVNMIKGGKTVQKVGEKMNSYYGFKVVSVYQTEEACASDHVAIANGLVPGDFISVYAPTGQLVTNAVSSGTTFTTPLPVESGYVVRVNDYTQKVVR
jgi:hypothetical protein